MKALSVQTQSLRRHLRYRLAGCADYRKLLLVGLVFAASSVFGGSALAQDYLTMTGVPTFSAPVPVEYGFVEAANGNLHLEFPLGSFPQRGGGAPYAARFIYDSHNVWQTYSTGTGTAWEPISYPIGTGWLYSFTSGGRVTGSELQELDYGSQVCGADFVWTDQASTSHYFPLPSILTPNSPPSGCSASGDAFAADSSGYHLYASPSIFDIKIYAPDGTMVYETVTEQDAQGHRILTRDANGNYISTSSAGGIWAPVYDTVGRQAFLSTYACNNSLSQFCFDVANSTGGALPSRYVVQSTSITVQTAFAQSGVITEYNGAMTVLASITLPDSTSINFKYDCDSTLNSEACSSPHGQSAYYGTLTGVTMPGGGQLTYAYTKFSDSYSNKSLWLTSRVGAGQGAWLYTPSVVSSCTSTQVGCQEQVTVQKPSGDKAVYTFTLDNGAWPTQIQQYDAQGNLLATTINAWDLSNACVLHGCYGHNYIRKLSETTTVLAPSGSLSKKVAYSYDSPQQGNVTAIKEWEFYPGTAPSFPSVPDRARYITYYSASTNIINKPQSITLCNNSGSDPYCTGGGGKVSQTLITYDSYGSGLTTVSGAANHDDGDYGAGNQARGNPTQIQQWVSGSTYLTTQNTFDTTGQVLQTTNSPGYATQYSYADNYYNETGATSMSPYSSSAVTNAYPTTVTRGSIQTTSTYYFGSGKPATSTDPNNTTTSYFFYDNFDRSTETLYPIGWNLTNYSSPTEVDGYAPVSDTSGSTACTSCQHSQVNFDPWGRKVNEKLVNAPGGAANMDTSYDSLNRVTSVSHAYVNPSDPTHVFETYSYDGLGRQTVVTHPDNQSVTTSYGTNVTAVGGTASQQGVATTYGYGYPAVIVDEAGKPKQEWTDGFGRVIEVDEPSTGGTPGTGSVSLAGTEQSNGTPGTPGTGSVAFSGSLKSTQVQTQAGVTAKGTVTIGGAERSVTKNPCMPKGNCPQTTYDSGTVSITVNGHADSTPYGEGSTSASVASGLVSAINGDSAAYVTATASGSVVSLTSKATGTATDYSLSASAVSTADIGSYTTATSGSTLTGGENATYTTVYDSGTSTITVNGHADSVSWSGSSTTTSSIAAALVSTINADSAASVSASLSGSTVNLTAKTTGTSTDYSLSSSSTYNPTYFSSASFTSSNSGSALTGGSNGTAGIYDSGTVWITVAGFQATTSYGQGSTSSSIAAALTSALNAGSPVSASASGSTITLTANANGSGTNYSLSGGSSTGQSGTFSQPSFSVSASGAALTGGTSNVSSPFVTLYTYDAADHLTEVIQGAQTRAFSYDGLGRPISITTPEAGTESLSYVSSGSPCSGDSENLCQKTDGRGVVTTYFYDGLDRIVGKSYSIPNGSNVAPMPNVCTTSTGASANVCYQYDQGGASAYALGRPTEMIDPSGSESYTYDAAGRVVQVAKVVGTATFATSYGYDAGDDITQVTYPSGRVVQQSYNPVGWLCEIAPSTSGCGSALAPFATGYSYNVSGQLTAFNYGNGVAASYSYSANRMQLTSLTFSKGTQNLVSLNYWYQQNQSSCPSGNSAGNNGQIQCITDGIDSGRTVNYTYDALRRLTAAATNGSSNFPRWGLSESYDQYGNRLCQTLTAGSGYQGCLSFANPGGAQTNHPDGWCFDASGNLLSKTASPCPPSNSTFIYDGENRLVSDGAAGFVYDGNGTRVQKCLPNCSNPSSSTVFVFAGSEDIAEYDNSAAPGSPSREFIYSDAMPGSGLLAQITAGSTPTTTYFLEDHLDWRASTDGTPSSPTYGQVNGQQGHYPFGESWYSTNGNEFVFTSYQRDSESGLDYAMARYYDSSAARFCSADPLGGRLDDPQTLNRYPYARNDPVNMMDPSGQGFLNWFFDALVLLADFLSAGTTAPETATAFGMDLSDLSLAAANAEAFEQTSKATQPQGNTPPPPLPPRSGPQVPPGYTPCKPVKFIITGVGPLSSGQATGKGATGTPPTNGDVAFNPKNYGLTNSQGRKIADSDNPLIFQPDWSKAEITTGKNATGTMKPAPDKGYPQVPDGLPVGTNDTLPGTDVIGGINRGANRNRIDLYRYPTQKQADNATRRVPVVVFIPNGSGAKCPK